MKNLVIVDQYTPTHHLKKHVVQCSSLQIHRACQNPLTMMKNSFKRWFSDTEPVFSFPLLAWIPTVNITW